MSMRGMAWPFPNAASAKRENSSRILGMAISEKPRPLSRTSVRTAPPAHRQPMITLSPRGVFRTAFPIRFCTTDRSRSGSDKIQALVGSTLQESPWAPRRMSALFSSSRVAD